MAAKVPSWPSVKPIGLFTNWPRSLAVATAMMAIGLNAAWLRSANMTDQVQIPVGNSGVILASGRDGITWHCDSYNGRFPSYRALTQRRHEQFSFLPPEDPLARLSDAEAEKVLSQGFFVPGVLDSLGGEAAPPIEDVGDRVSWSGITLQWSGLFVERSPWTSTLVIPYGFLAIPLTLVSAMLVWMPSLARRCHPLQVATSVAQTPGPL